MRNSTISKISLIILFSVLAGAANAGYTVTWTAPTENTDGSPLTDLAGYKLWCLKAANNYGTPAILPPTDTEYVKDWAGPGDWKCKMRAFNDSGQDSADSTEIFFTIVDPDGDGNGVVLKPLPPDPDDPGAGLVVRSNAMEITRKGYYTILSPDGDQLTKPDGSLRQCTSRDECYEWITKDGRAGTFTLQTPTFEVKYE